MKGSSSPPGDSMPFMDTLSRLDGLRPRSTHEGRTASGDTYPPTRTGAAQTRKAAGSVSSASPPPLGWAGALWAAWCRSQAAE